MRGDVKLFAGSASKQLAEQIAQQLKTRIEPTDITRFSDGEIRVELKSNVRGCHAFVIASTCKPANDMLMELMLLADALKRSSVETVTAVIPYYGYARQDRRPGYARVPISARVVADMLEGVGISHIITMDLHATQIQGMFSIPVDNISATQLFVGDIYSHWMDQNPIIVSPDVGGVARARAVAKHLGEMELAIVDKRRPKANVSEVMNIIGDVEGRTCIIIDDMVDTAGTLGKAADALIQHGGAKRVVAYATHGVLSGKASINLHNSMLSELVVTDTIPADCTSTIAGWSKVRYLSTANILAETIARVQNGNSISEILE